MKNQRGTTLIETLVVTIIFTIVGGTAFSLFASGTRVFSRETVAVGLQTDVAGAVNIFLDDVSVAGYSPDAIAVAKFPSAPTLGTSADSVQFVADITSNGISDLVTYDVSGGNLRRRVQTWSAGSWTSGSTEILASDVQSFTLTFLDGNRATLSAAQVQGGNAKYAQVSLSARAMAKGGFVTKSLFAETALRNS